jgi:hypothetical protein
MSARDRAIGGAILGGSVLAIIGYGVLLLCFAKAVLAVLEATAFTPVAVLLGIFAWTGWTIATTPTPEPMPEAGPSEPGMTGQAA